jgi:hypothetical protein
MDESDQGFPVLTRDGEVVLVCSTLTEAIKAAEFYSEEFPDHVWEVAS